MKLTHILPTLAVALACLCAPAAAQAQLKIGTIDMKSVFDQYYKTKEQESKINEARTQAKKELDDRMDTFNKAQEEARRLNEEANKPELAEKAKADKVKALQEKLQELEAMQREIREFQQTRERQLNEQSVRSRNGLVEEINKAINEKVKAGNYDLVFDKSGQSLNAVNVLIHSKDSYDMTSDVIADLNKGQKKDKK